jgi:hypothetical protein
MVIASPDAEDGGMIETHALSKSDSCCCVRESYEEEGVEWQGLLL